MSTLATGQTAFPIPQRGDLVRVDWRDIYEDVTGNPDKPHLARRVSYGLYWGSEVLDGIACIVTTTTEDEHQVEGNQQGYCVYPAACVVELSIEKRRGAKAKKRTKKRPVEPDYTPVPA